MFSLCPRENKDAGGQALAKATGHHEHDLKQQRQANVFHKFRFQRREMALTCVRKVKTCGKSFVLRTT